MRGVWKRLGGAGLLLAAWGLSPAAAPPPPATGPTFLPVGGTLAPPVVAARGEAGLLLRLEEGFAFWDRTSGRVRPLPLDPKPGGPAFGALQGGELLLAVDEAFSGGGLWRYDPATGKGVPVPLPPAVREEFAREERALSAYPAGPGWRPSPLRYCGLLDASDRLYLPVAGSGLLEWRPDAGAFRVLSAGAVREAVGPQPCPCPLPLGDRLLTFTPRGLLVRDPGTGGAFLLAPRDLLASPEGLAGVELRGLQAAPADLTREEAEALADLAAAGPPPVPLPSGFFLGNGLFLEDGELASRPPWPSAWLDEPEEGLSAAFSNGTLYAVFNALCGEEGRSFLLRTRDGGRHWEARPLSPPPGRGGRFHLLEASESSLLLAFADEEGGGDSLAVLPPGLVFSPLPRGPCGPRLRPPEGEEEPLPGFTRRRLWKGLLPETPTPSPQPPAAPPPPAAGTARPPTERPAGAARNPSA